MNRAQTTAPVSVITPTVGRVVWFWVGAENEGQPEAAIVTYVHGDRMVNLTVFDHNGRPGERRSVHLAQPGDTGKDRPVACFATWMPYQVGQAEKHAAA
jgi:hypothetical protein